MSSNNATLAKFKLGQIIRHRLFNYRGAIFDVDAQFCGTDEWYQIMARTRPPKDNPWYHVLVDNSQHITYVAEQNLSEEINPTPIRHPALNEFFQDFSLGIYTKVNKIN